MHILSENHDKTEAQSRDRAHPHEYDRDDENGHGDDDRQNGPHPGWNQHPTRARLAKQQEEGSGSRTNMANKPGQKCDGVLCAVSMFMG